jgi:NADH-quinone oxidoreductase subunit E
MSTSTVNENYSALISRYPAERSSLIPILQEIQSVERYLPADGIFQVADYLKLPVSKIFGVATFYNQFKLTKPGLHEIQICRGTACHVNGSQNLLDIISAELGIESGETTSDDFFSLEIVACLGACSMAPVMTIDGEFYGRLDRKKVHAILDGFRTKED